MSDHNIPKSRFARFTRLARAGASTGKSILLGDKQSTKSTVKNAQKAAALLGEMRALGAKVGQMLAYVDGMLPPEQQAIFAEHLKPLLEHTPTSSFTSIQALLEQELGKPLEELFAEFDQEPIASASLGQVHRAVLHSGEEVAVKVQHPGIDEALAQDLKNIGFIENIAGMLGGSKFNSKEMVQEVKARFLEELDYTLEANNQLAFRAFFEDNPDVVVPNVYASHSSERVLTSEFVHGMGYDEACAHPSEELRAKWSAVLWRFVYESTLKINRFNADPHPGNYRFKEDGRVVFFDFGCIQNQPPERSLCASQVHLSAAMGDEERFKRYCRELMGLKGGQWEGLALEYMRLCFEPQFSSPFRFDTEYVREVVRFLQDLKFDIIKMRDGSFVPLQEGMLFVNRLQFGFYSVLSGLNASVDYAAIELDYLSDRIQHADA